MSRPNWRKAGRVRRLAACLILLAAILFPLAAGAQGDPPAIRLMETAFGSIDGETTDHYWQFEAESGDRVSVLAQAVSGDLDPYLQVIGPDGDVLAENDDAEYPARLDAALEAVEIPRDGAYTVRVTRFGMEEGTSEGDFALALLPADAAPVLWETFSGETEWSMGSGDSATLEIADGQLELAASEADTLAWAAPSEAGVVPLRAYVQVEAEVQNEPDYWEYGLIFRQSGPTNYYVFAVSSRGDWAFLARTGPAAWTEIQDWTEHPALSDPQPNGTLGVLMDGDEFTFYYNGEELGAFEDDTHADAGTVAVSAGTVDRQEEMPVIRYDNLIVTEPIPVPAEPAAEEDSGGAPLASWEARDTAPIIAELVEQEVIPEGGQQRMFVPEGFTTVSRPGIQFLALGQGRTQTDFVMGSTIFIESESGESGCGLVFRRAGDDRYSVFFVDGRPGYGVAEWNGSVFDPAFYALSGSEDENPLLRAGENNRVILVGQGDEVRVYLNGQLAVTRPNPATQGGVGIAALSFDGAFVNCQFFNTWLWTWE